MMRPINTQYESIWGKIMTAPNHRTLIGPDHGSGHLVLSVLSYSALWRTEGRWRYVDGR